MALIKCKECEKEISDTVKKCPNCGYQERKFNKKKLIVGGGIICGLLIVVSIMSFLLSYEKPLTGLEKQAVECAKDYKSMLKNPESFQIHDIRWEENVLAEEVIFIYLDVSGQNGFGGNNRHIIRYSVGNNKIGYQASSNDEDDDNWLVSLVAKKINEDYPKLLEDDSAKISAERVFKAVIK